MRLSLCLLFAVVMSLFVYSNAFDVTFCNQMCDRQQQDCRRSKHRGRQDATSDSACDAAHTSCLDRCNNPTRL